MRLFSCVDLHRPDRSLTSFLELSWYFQDEVGVTRSVSIFTSYLGVFWLFSIRRKIKNCVSRTIKREVFEPLNTAFLKLLCLVHLELLRLKFPKPWCLAFRKLFCSSFSTYQARLSSVFSIFVIFSNCLCRCRCSEGCTVRGLSPLVRGVFWCLCCIMVSNHRRWYCLTFFFFCRLSESYQQAFQKCFCTVQLQLVQWFHYLSRNSTSRWHSESCLEYLRGFTTWSTVKYWYSSGLRINGYCLSVFTPFLKFQCSSYFFTLSLGWALRVTPFKLIVLSTQFYIIVVSSGLGPIFEYTYCVRSVSLRQRIELRA